MISQARGVRSGFVAFLILFTVFQAAGADVLEDARALLAERRPADAYALLAPQEMELAGTPVYDYLLGMAALDTGRSDEAVFSLQRAVAAEPDFAGARMELARAHFESGELPEARVQFEYLLTQSAPPDTRAVIEKYLAAIQGAGGARSGSQLAPYFEVGSGYDSNANGSTGEHSFLGFTLDPRNVETESAFLELAAGVNHALPTGAGAGWLSGVRLSHRFNPDADFIDQSIVSAGTSFNGSRNRWRGNLGANGYYGLLDGAAHEWGAALDVGAGTQIAAKWDLSLSVRGGLVRYDQDALEVLDVERYLGALTLTNFGIGTRSGRWGLTLIGGIDEERQDGSPYGNDRSGARLFGGWALAAQSTVYLEAGYLQTAYSDSPGFFGLDRKDEETSALVVTEYRDWPARGWSLNPRLRYVQHESNIALYDYDRWEASVYLRRSFR